MKVPVRANGRPGAMVVWSPGLPAELRAALEPTLRRWLYLLPTWCHTIHVGLGNDLDSDVAARMEGEIRYRRAALSIGPAFLRVEDRDTLLAHELVHVALNPLDDFVDELTDRLDGELAGWACDRWRELLEGATEDLARAATWPTGT